jgi:hypothetical protein
MSAPPSPVEPRFRQLSLIRDLLQLIGRMRQITDPVTSPEGLRQAIELLLSFAELLGLSQEVTQRLRQILDNEIIFQIVLGIVRFLLGEGISNINDGHLHATFGDGSTFVVEAKDFLSWLPIVVQIINLIRFIRGQL